MKRSLIAALIALCLWSGVGPQQAIAAATLLPNGEQCFSANTGTTGMVGLLGTVTGGSGGTAGTYGGVALTGGSGSGATANITVSGGAVTSVTILNPGSQYVVGDVLSALAATIGSTTGFSVPVSSISINSSLAGGTVAFYVPNTSTFKQTWSNSTQTTLNTNPVQLDANGCAVIYGTGSYRQVLKDSLGNTIWDQVTADTSSYNSTFWAGTANGTPNVITVVDPGFNGTDGSIINFVPISTNTGPTTLNPSSFGATSIVKDTTSGPIALAGGEIIATSPSMPNIVSVIYSANQNNFHLLNTVIASASGATAPLCGASGLVVTNDSASPNSILNLTASQVLMQNTAGLVINRSSVSLTAINITTGTSVATANGMDGESPGTSQWLYLWAIDNGSAAAGLVSTSSTSPTMPSGYTYKCRMAAVRVDGSSDLLRILQRGSNAIYNVTATTNTTVYPTIASGSTSLTATSESITGVVPPTASGITVQSVASSSAHRTIVGPTIATNANVMDVNIGGGSNSSIRTLSFTLVSASTISYGADDASCALNAVGWKDSINAN